LYKLLSRVLPVSYKPAHIQYHIVQAIPATPPRTSKPFDPSNIRLDPFPHHIYPQLRSLKRAIAKANGSRQMEPLHWQSGFRADRPFEPIQNHLTIPQHPPPPPQQARRQRQIPTQYYLEQAAFYAEIPGPDPFAAEPEVYQPGLLKVLVLKCLTAVSRVAVPGLNFLAGSVSELLLLSRMLASWACRPLFKRLCTFVESVEWEALLALAIANQFAKLLPGMAGKMLADGVESDAPPLYTIFLQAGLAIGNGPVIAGSL
jgi:hypothetical protein